MGNTHERIVVGGSMGDPVHPGHITFMAEVLRSGRFTDFDWYLSGMRPGKTPVASAADRIMMSILAFGEIRQGYGIGIYLGSTRFSVHFEDAHRMETPTIRRLERIRAQHPDATITWCTGADALIPRVQYEGKSEVEAVWVEGPRLLAEWPCLVLPRKGYPHPRTFPLPPDAEILDVETPNIASTTIRERLVAGESADDLLSDDVARYIVGRGLYRVGGRGRGNP